MEIHPYVSFNGRCEEAIEFYKRTLRAEVKMLMRFEDSPEPAPPGMLPPGSEKKVMHSELRIGKSVFMASDGECTGSAQFSGVTLSLYADTVAEADRLFAALADGGQVRMPIGKTFFSERFGIVADRFGLGWMVLVAPPESPR